MKHLHNFVEYIKTNARYLRRACIMIYPLNYLIVLCFPDMFRKSVQPGVLFLQENPYVNIILLAGTIICNLLGARYTEYWHVVVFNIGAYSTLALAWFIFIATFISAPFATGIGLHMFVAASISLTLAIVANEEKAQGA